MIAVIAFFAISLAPNFTLHSLRGSEVHLADYRGKVVVLNFWATWCGGCKVEMPELAELDRRYRAKGLVVLGVSMDDPDVNNDAVARFAKSKTAAYTIVRGDDAVAKVYGNVQELPHTFVIDRSGHIADDFTGVPDKKTFEGTLTRLLAGTPASRRLDGRHPGAP